MESYLENRTFDAFLAAAEKKEIVLFGAGGYVPVAQKLLQAYSLKIEFIIDNDFWKWGKEVCGLPVFAPDKLDPDISVVLISPQSFFAIEEQLLELGVKDYFALPLFVEQLYEMGPVAMTIPLR